MSNAKSTVGFFTATTHPYYICAPNYRQNSAGIRCLHYLCHILNEAGYEAYIAPATVTNPYLRTPGLTRDIATRHFQTGRTPIAVYPEVISGNPLRAPVVARWLLNKPGLLGGDTEYDPAELLFAYDPWTLPANLQAPVLRIPSIDTRIFHNRDNPHDGQRKGFCYYANKYLATGAQVDPFLVEHGISLGQDIVRSHEEIASLLRQVEYLYCYEQSALIQEALACGCPVIIKKSEYWTRTRWASRYPGTAEEDDSASFALIKSEVAQYATILEWDRKECWELFTRFTELTQAEAERVRATPTPIDAIALDKNPALAWISLPEQRSQLADVFAQLLAPCFPAAPRLADESTSFPDFSLAENSWLAKRRLLDSDGYLLAESAAAWKSAPTFHLFTRLDDQQQPLLAETLDGLNHQLYGHWHIDVVTTLAAPPGIEAVSALGWHCIADDAQAKATIDFLVAAGRRDWIIELPPGAVLDPLCLWRLVDEINRHPEMQAFYFDDDSVDELGIRKQVRFKPRPNAEWLRSLDLAGPLLIARKTWREIGGASPFSGSPWYDQMLRFQEHQPAAALGHVADVLISYPGGCPVAANDCLHALLAQQQRLGIAEEIVPAGENCWRTLPNLEQVPPVSICIISAGQLEFLADCLANLLEMTTYPAVELLLAWPKGMAPDLDDWVEQALLTHSPLLREVTVPPGSNHIEACNVAIATASHSHLVLLREDCRVLQENWLHDLVRSMAKPDVAAVSPRLVQPVSGLLENIGNVAGLGAAIDSPYRHQTHYSEPGYLSAIQVARDIQSAPAACLLLDREALLAAGGLEPIADEQLAIARLGQQLRSNGKRFLYQPQITVVHYCDELRETPRRIETGYLSPCNHPPLTDPFWNPNLSLSSTTPVAEKDFHPSWQYLPNRLPHIAARPVLNAQGDYRVSGPLKALRQAGKALECLWPQSDDREFTAAELARLAPDSLIVQNYLLDPRITGLEAWRTAGLDTFIVYALDDLFTEMPLKSSLRQGVPANARTRFREALRYCNRLVVSTEFLAEAYRPLFPDIRVVPNRLERERWLNLTTHKRTGNKPRIGWAGGTAHRGDLELIKPVIEATRDEADWIFMGMHTDEIRPLLSEFHPGVSFEAYPEALAALDLDIAVAPLEMHRFNQGKSNLRLLEYGALSLPVVCTDIDPYRDSPACCLANDPQRWIAALRERIHDADAREAEGKRLHDWVAQHYILENHLDEWLAAHLP